MLTRRGWALAVGALGLAVAGRVLGVLELFVLAAGAWALVGVALVRLAARPSPVRARRTLTPARVGAGDDSFVELALANAGRRATAVLELRDPVGGGPRRARLLLAPMAPGEERTAGYRIPTERRGIVAVGPLQAHRFDPLGLASAARVVAPVTELIVHPAVEALVPAPSAPGDERRGGWRRATATGQAGQDFYALRPWVVGDDLRRVHWPSTARRDELMVRQHDLPWQGRATVVLDTDDVVHDEESFETAVSAAASVLVASARAGSLVRLVGTDGFDSGFGAGPAHVDGLLDRLSRVTPVSSRGAGPLGTSSGSVVLVVSAAVAGDALAAMARRAGRPGSVTVVAVVGDGQEAAAVAGARTVAVPAGGPVAPAWNRAMAATAVVPGQAR